MDIRYFYCDMDAMAAYAPGVSTVPIVAEHTTPVAPDTYGPTVRMLVVDLQGNETVLVGGTEPSENDDLGVTGTRSVKLTTVVAIRTKRAQIDQVLKGYLSTVGGEFNGRYFEIDDIAMSRLNAALTIATNYEAAFGAGSWDGMEWTDLNNNLYFVPNLQIFGWMIMRLGAQGSGYYTNWQRHKYAVNQMADPVEILAYDSSTGWTIP